MKKGHTLIEMIIVLTVMVVLSSIFWPAMSRFLARQRFKHKVGQVVVELKQARLESIKTGEKISIKDITFYPNGTMSNKTVIIEGHNRSAVVKTNGITGIRVEWNY